MCSVSNISTLLYFYFGCDEAFYCHLFVPRLFIPKVLKYSGLMVCACNPGMPESLGHGGS